MNKSVLIGIALVLLAGLAGAGWYWQQQRVLQQAYAAGMAAADAGRYEEALSIALPHADRDDPQIDHLLGMIYINGPDSIKDIDKGLTHRRAAADAGNMQAKFLLGYWLLENGTTTNESALGVRLITRSADCGMPIAHYLLSGILSSGDAETDNLDEALKHAEFAAWAGVPQAQWNYYVIYFRLLDSGADQDSTQELEPLYWLFTAAASGDPNATRIIDSFIEDFSKRNLTDELHTIESFKKEAARRQRLMQSTDPYQCNFQIPIQ